MYRFFKILWNGLFKTRRSGYTLRGFWGEKKHYNKYGVQIGYSLRGFWGGWKRYDMEGNLISYTLRNFWGGYDTYDADGNLKRKSRRNFWGGFHTYTPNGEKVMESYRSFWGGVNHYEADEPMKDRELPNKTVNMPGQTQAETRSKQTSPLKTVQSPQATQSPQVTPILKATQNTTIQPKDKSFAADAHVENKKGEETQPRRESEDYNELLREIDNTEAEKYEFRDLPKAENAVNLLVFSYGELKGFPARAYIIEDAVEIEPLIKGERTFTFSKEEIAQATRRMIDNLDMMDMENEFSSLNGSSLLPEFEDLFPEYEYGANGVTRAQYELACGMIITENSWINLNMLNKH